MCRPLLLSFSLLVILPLVELGAVGECRSECLEQNRYKIVRVHLAETFVRVGLCQNATMAVSDLRSQGTKSIVIPYVCNRYIGLWTLDEDDEEGIEEFARDCPPPKEESILKLATCPRDL